MEFVTTQMVVNASIYVCGIFISLFLISCHGATTAPISNVNNIITN